MKRMPPFLSDCTERFPRVSSSTNAEFHAGPCGWKYRTPIYKRVIFTLGRPGTLLIAVVLAFAATSLSGCVDMETEEATAATDRDRAAEAMALRGVR